jgi:DNA-binding transcriptional ArsR family regulator
MSAARGTPLGFDPDRDVMVDARNLRGLAHPLRLRMLGLLRESGPATATQLAGRLGESSAATSYHLRQLAEYGFVVEDERRRKGRERWWQSAHRSSYFDATADESEEARLLGETYLRSVVRALTARMEAWVDALPAIPPEWRRGSGLSDYRAELTAEEAAELVARLESVGTELRDTRGRRSGNGEARRVVFQFQVLPDPRSVLDEGASTDA